MKAYLEEHNILEEYKIIRSDRKTVAIHITNDATIEVRAPYLVSKDVIDEFLKLKERWILEKLHMMREFKEKRIKFTLDYGEKILLRGEDYTIKGVLGNKIYFKERDLCIPFNLNKDEIKYNVIKMYKLQAKNILIEKIRYYSKYMDVKPIAVKINSDMTRWGSCSGRNSLNFSWRVILAKDDIINYVVVHELAHIKEHNHSKRFWKEVERLIPDFKVKIEELKNLQYRLTGEDWD